MENKNPNIRHSIVISLILILVALIIVSILISSLRILFKIIVTSVGLGLFFVIAYGVFCLCKQIMHNMK